MSDVSEDALDRHFALQLKLVSDVFIKSICTTHHDIIHRWLLIFYAASGSQKYARNCLMILMYGQLKEMGRLSKPFTDLNNITRRLDDVLATYENIKEHELGRKAVASDLDSNCSSYGDGSRQQSSEAGDKSDYEVLSERNRQLLDEVNELCARTVESEQHYKRTDCDLQKKDVLQDEPETRNVLMELDRKLENALDGLLEQAGERREKNVRILYDKLFQQQQELLQAKDELIETVQEALAEARQQLQAIGSTRSPLDHQDYTKQTPSVEDALPTSNSSCHCSQCKIRKKRSSVGPSPLPSPSSSSASPTMKKERKNTINTTKCSCEQCKRFKMKSVEQQC